MSGIPRTDSNILLAMMEEEEEQEQERINNKKNPKNNNNSVNDADSFMSGDEDEVSVSHDSGSGTSPSSSDFDARIAAQTKSNELDIARQEHQAVMIFKFLMTLILIMVTIGVAVAVFFFVSSEEYDSFYYGFEEASIEIFEAIGTYLTMDMSAIDAFAVTLVSYAASQTDDMNWPFVTLPDHGVRASKTRTMTKALALEQYHLVNNIERQSWENYAFENEAWVQESIDVQLTDPSYEGAVVTEYKSLGKMEIYYNDLPLDAMSGP
jgi:hypothetical protein